MKKVKQRKEKRILFDKSQLAPLKVDLETKKLLAEVGLPRDVAPLFEFMSSKNQLCTLCETLHFMKAYYDVAHHRTLAFGDSGNDIDMLKAVEHGYLLFNATDEAKGLHDQHASSAYGEGIMEVCQQVFTSIK